jgi:hypothetical protein
MKEERVDSDFNVIKMLWARKFYYVAGFIIGIILGLINITLGKDIKIIDLFIVPLGCSFLFGYLLYVFMKEPEKVKKYGPFFVFSGEGILHLVLGIGSIIVYGLIYNILKYSFHFNI